MQRVLSSSVWEVEAVRDELRDWVVEALGHPDAVVVMDETGFLKKGRHSVGVQRQYSGTAGRIENCQIGVFLAYASPRGQAFLDRELYLPERWASDCERRRAAGVPETVTFKTKPQLAKVMLSRALAAHVPMRWVTGDEVYGNDRPLRRWLEAQRVPYVLAVKRTEGVWWSPTTGLGRITVAELTDALPETAWRRLSAGPGTKGPRLYDWAAWSIRPPHGAWGSWFLVRRRITAPIEFAYYVAFGPAETSLEELVAVAGQRWTIEEGFERAKGDVGLDHYEVRHWTGWYRHVTLALLAHALLAITRARSPPPARVVKPEKGGTR